MLRRFSFNSILARLLVSFLLIVTPIIAVGIVMFVWEKQTIRDQIEESARDNVSFLQANLDNEIGSITLLQYNLSSDTTLNELAVLYKSLPKYDYYTLIRDARQRLMVIKNSNNFIADVNVYFPEMRYVVSTSGEYPDFDANEYLGLLQEMKKAKYPLIISAHNMKTVTVFPFTTKTGEVPMYLSEILISPEIIEDMLAKFNKYNVSNTALYDYNSGNWIFNARSNLANVSSARLDIVTSAAGKNVNVVARIDGKSYYVISAYSGYLNISVVQFVPLEDIFRTPNKFGNFLWVYAVLTIMIMLLYAWSSNRSVKYPVKMVLAAFKQLENGDMGSRVHLKAAKEFNDLFDGFNTMAFRLNELIDKSYRQELYAKRSELKQLQSQINPHFLYNSFFILHRMIKYRDLQNADLLSSYLGKYFQYITRNALDEVSLRSEVEHADSYAQIQMLRFAERLCIEFGEIPGNYADLPVPRMILQPILENSLEHGLKSSAQNGLVRIWFAEDGPGLVITVEDNGTGLTEADIEKLREKTYTTEDNVETTGVINVHRRIALRYGPGSGVSFFRSSLGGLKVEIRISAAGRETEK